MPFRVVVLVSGSGSNLQALLRHPLTSAHVVAVISDRPRCLALQKAANAGLPTRAVPARDYAARSAWDRALADAVSSFDPNLVVLAGFMRIVGPPLLRRFSSRIINVHPSLLPAFPGLDAPKQAIDAGVRITGCTVHLVDEGVDTGPILAQAAIPVAPDDDASRLHQRIQALEHRLLPEVVQWVAAGDLLLEPEIVHRRPALSPVPLFSPGLD